MNVKQQLIMNAAHIMNSVRPLERTVADKLVWQGWLKRGLETGTYEPTARKYKIQGPRVRFTLNHLGSSEAHDLSALTHDEYGIGDEGTLVFQHPYPQRCPDWFYVEVDSRSPPHHKVYVGVDPACFEFVNPADTVLLLQFHAADPPGVVQWAP